MTRNIWLGYPECKEPDQELCVIGTWVKWKKKKIKIQLRENKENHSNNAVKQGNKTEN